MKKKQKKMYIVFFLFNSSNFLHMLTVVMHT